MPRLVDDYLASARQFERLARVEDRPDVRQLLQDQAQACYRLAARKTQVGQDRARARRNLTAHEVFAQAVKADRPSAISLS
jgi:hypothetical protein